MSPKVVEDVKQNIDTDDTRDEVFNVKSSMNSGTVTLWMGATPLLQHLSLSSQQKHEPPLRFLEGITFFLEEFSLGSCPLWLEELGNWKEEPKIWLWLTS